MVDSVSVRFKNARVEKNAFKHSYTVECGSRLRVGVRAKNASVSGFACRPSFEEFGVSETPSQRPLRLKA